MQKKNKKRDDLINKGRHEIADPVSKKLGQISERMAGYVEKVQDEEKETLGIVRDLAVEIKDEKDNPIAAVQCVGFRKA